MIVPRFTFFTENFVIRCDQVTKIFRSGHDCTSTSSARSPRYFHLRADIAIWVLRKVRVDTVLTEPGSTFPRDSIGNSWEELEVSRYPGSGFRRGPKRLRSSTKFSLNSCSQSGNSCNRSLWFSSRPSFIFLVSVSVGLCIGSPRSSSLVLLLLSDTGLVVHQPYDAGTNTYPQLCILLLFF